MPKIAESILLAFVQCCPCGDWSSNLRQIGRDLERTEGDLVLLPEMFATGFRMGDFSCVQPVDGPIVRQIRRWAQEQHRALVGSVAVEEKGCRLNRMFFVRPSGEMEWYDKRHLFRPGGEAEYFTPGSERRIVTYRGFRFLLQLCYDLRFPVWSRNRDDYDVILYGAAWPASRGGVWHTLLRARAIENQAYVVGANWVGFESGTRYAGRSVILDFRGEPLVEGDVWNASHRSARIDRGELSDFRRKFPVWMDADDFTIQMS